MIKMIRLITTLKRDTVCS